MEGKSKSWLPLEGNPSVFNDFAYKLGYPIEKYKFYDVYTLDPKIWIDGIPKPVVAVILLFQMKEQH